MKSKDYGAHFRPCPTCECTGDAWTAQGLRVDCPDCSGEGVLEIDLTNSPDPA